MSYFFERLKEPSTWRGIMMLGASFGLTINPDIAAMGMAVAGGIGALTADK